jgi:hypothetical protein
MFSTPIPNNFGDQSHIVAAIYAHRQNHFVAAISKGIIEPTILGSIPTALAVVEHAELIEEGKSDGSATPNAKLAFLFDLLLPPDEAEETRTYLDDIYETRWSKRYSERAAWAIYSYRVISVIAARYWERVAMLVAFIKSLW